MRSGESTWPRDPSCDSRMRAAALLAQRTRESGATRAGHARPDVALPLIFHTHQRTPDDAETAIAEEFWRLLPLGEGVARLGEKSGRTRHHRVETASDRGTGADEHRHRDQEVVGIRTCWQGRRSPGARRWWSPRRSTPSLVQFLTTRESCARNIFAAAPAVPGPVIPCSQASAAAAPPTAIG